tara:strand:+ start:33173 stop:33808 length:636 start_codon:yes stop_codon:yes gene_type:complete
MKYDMSGLTFTNDEIERIRLSVKEGHLSWSHDRLKGIKRRIKIKNLAKQFSCCCYCSRELKGEFAMVIDIEHIIPKSKLPKHMFSPKNLSVSCKRCNMEVKKACLEFLTQPLNTLPKRVFKSRFYRFIHPNLDNYDAHLKMHTERLGRKKRLLKYRIINGSSKGTFTYEYFKLKNLELSTFDEAQGATERVEISEPSIADAFDVLENSYLE